MSTRRSRRWTRHQARNPCIPSEAWPSLTFIDGAVSINPTQSRQDDTLLHVGTKTLILVLGGRKRGRAAGRLSSTSLSASQATGRPHQQFSRRCQRKISLAPMPGGALFSTGCRTGGRAPPLATSLRRAGAPGLARLSSLRHYLHHRDQLHHQETLRPGRCQLWSRDRGWRQQGASSIPLVGFRTLGARGRKRNC